jgi:hypothetical protein
MIVFSGYYRLIRIHTIGNSGIFMQIIIFGMHRSGTSMTTRLINLMGAYVGAHTISSAQKNDNPTGFWERNEALAINDVLLKQRGCSWDKVEGFRTDLAPHASLHDAMHTFLHEMDAHAPWVLKDPRMCLVFPDWQPLLGTPIAVVVYRNPYEIALSLHKRNGFSLEFGLALWECYATHLLKNTQTLPRIHVHHKDLIERPTQACEYLYDRLTALGATGLTMPERTEIEAFIDPTLYRSKTNESYTLSAHQQSLADQLRGIKK